MNLKCPKCGFAFGFACDDDEPEENILIIKTCICGTIMEETEYLENIFPRPNCGANMDLKE